MYEGRKVNFDIVTADVCVLRCFLATTPEANYLRFHARVDTASAITQSHSTSYSTETSKTKKIHALRNKEAPSCNYFCSGRSINITYSLCMFVGLVIHYAPCVRHIVVCYLSGCTLFFHFHTRHDFRKIIFEYKMCVLIVSTTLSETFRNLRRTERDVI